MLALIGTFQNGYIKFDKEYSSSNPIKVIVTFLDENSLNVEKQISLNDFSFSKSQNNLIDFKGSFSDAVESDRRKEL